MSDAITVAVVIPAHDEEPRVADVVSVALASGVGPVWVIDDGSRDRTAVVAREAGAEVVSLAANVGKGGALVEAARRIDADLFVLLDADLTGLQPRHVTSLVDTVLRGEAETTRGVFGGARWSTTMAQRITPQLSGQRVVPSAWLSSIPALETSRFGVEWWIERLIRTRGARRVDVVLDGAAQVMKEEKRGAWRGAWSRLRMYGDILRAMTMRAGR